MSKGERISQFVESLTADEPAPGGEGALPNKEQTENDDRDVREDVAEEEDVQDAARILAEDADEFLE